MAKITDKTVKSKYPPKQTNVTWIDTSQKPAVTKSYIDGAWIVVGGGGGTKKYSDLEEKPLINGVELDGNKTSSDLGMATSQQGAKADTAYQKPLSGIPDSDLSSDVQQALQKHFKGWLTSTSQLPANPVVGDYAYVEDNGTTYIYRCTTDGEWPETSTEEKDPTDVTFAGGQEVNETYIDDTHLVNPAEGSLPKAEDVKDIKDGLYGYYDDSVVSDTDYYSPYMSSTTLGTYTMGGSFELDGNNKYYWKGASVGVARINYIPTSVLATIKGTFKKLRVKGGPSSSNYSALVMFAKKELPQGSNLTFQQLSEGGYICQGFTEDNYITIISTLNYLPNGKALVIPDDAQYFYAVRVTSNSQKREPSSIVPFSSYVKGDIETIQEDIEELQQGIPDNAVTTAKIADGAVTSEKIAEGAVTSEKIAEGAVNDSLTGTEEYLTSYNLLDVASIKGGYAIKSSDGSEAATSTTAAGASPFMRVEPGKKYYLFGGGYGNVGGSNQFGAVYNGDKQYIRSVQLNSAGASGQPFTALEGDAYIRHTMDTTATVQALLPALDDGTQPSISGIINQAGNIQLPFTEKMLATTNSSLIIGVDSVPFAKPSMSLTGSGRAVVTNESLTANTPLSLTSLSTKPYPQYMKGCHTISFKGFIANALSDSDFVRIGVGRTSSSGKTIKITGSTISIDYYDSGNDTYVNCKSPVSHGLTVSGFIMCEISLWWNGGKVRLICQNGCFVHEWNIDDYNTNAKLYARESQGIASLIANVAMTNVELSQTSDRFMKPIWIFGDSYTSVYQYSDNGRWPYSMIYTYGIDGFLLDGFAGAESKHIYPDLVKALEYGTPKYLVWCFGLNDASSAEVVYFNYAKQVEMLCKERGITLIYEKVPYRWDQNDAFRARLGKINDYIENSGYRYIDFFSAVSADSEGHWYSGMLKENDNAHPTPLGAQVLAGQILTDFPEIANYK